jgi:uncharacterized protein
MRSMAIDRRFFLTAAGATLLPGAWRPARASDTPRYISAAATLTGRQAMVALSDAGDVLYDLDLLDRGHGLAARPGAPEAVCFGRRPGTFALVFDLASGDEIATITSPRADRHFSGHGVYSLDGRFLLLTENDMTARRGIIGVYDAAAAYARVREFWTGGIGPHDLRLMQDGETLVVANGGFDHRHDEMTEAEFADIRSDLTYLDWRSGAVREQVKLDPIWSHMTIRHLAITADGRVVAALQDSAEVPDLEAPLGFLHRPGERLTWMETPQGGWRRFRGYCGGVAVDLGGGLIAMSSPRGNCVGLWDGASGAFADIAAVHDGCGISATDGADHLLVSSGGGELFTLARGSGDAVPFGPIEPSEFRFDNHLLRIAG